MSENLAKCRRSLKISQSKMADVADMGLTAYRYKEEGKKPFRQDEILRIYNFLVKECPDITIAELFFNDLVIETITN